MIITNWGKDFINNKIYEWQLKLPLVQQMAKEREEIELQASYSNYELEKVLKEKEDYKEAADNLLEMVQKANEKLNLQQVVGEGYGSNVRTHLREITDTNPQGGMRDTHDDPIDKWEPPKLESSIFPKIEIPEEEPLGRFDKERIGEAEFIEGFFYGNQAYMIRAMNNKNRILGEVDRKVPLTLTSHMEPHKVINITNIRVLGDNQANDQDNKEYICKPLPTGVDHAIASLYSNNRMRLDLYDHDGILLNPSVEDKYREEAGSLWQSIKGYFGFN